LIRPRYFKSVFVGVYCLILVGGLPAQAQPASSATIAPAKGKISSAKDLEGQLLPGVVVEKVEKNSEAEKAGLREGDVLLSWSRGDEQGKIESPFDVSWIDIEQRPRGTVELHGVRGKEVRAWHPGQMSWSIPCRPNLSRSILPIYRKAGAQFKAAKFASSSAYLVQAANRVSPNDPAWLRAWLLVRAAESLEKVHEFKRADQLIELAVQQISDSNPLIRGGVLRASGEAMLNGNDLRGAERSYQLALVESQRLDAHSLLAARDLDRLGFVELLQANLALATDYYQKALQIHGALIPDQLDMLVTLDGLVAVLTNSDDMRSADKYLNQMRHIENRFPPNSWTAMAIATQGRMNFYRGDLAEAEADSRRALAIYQSLGTSACLCHSVNLTEVLGVISWWRGDFERARQYFVKALSLERRDDPHGRTIASIHVNLASFLTSIGKLNAAESEARRALIITGKLGPEGSVAAQAYGQLGLIYEGRGNFSQSQRYLERAASLQQKLNPQSFELVDSLNDIGKLFSRAGNLKNASIRFHEALAIEEKVFPGSLEHITTLNALANIAWQTADLNAAEDLYRRALAALENQSARLGGAPDERSVFRANHSNIYTAYAHILVTRGKAENAFEVLEASRARTLFEILNLAQIDIHNGAAPQLIERERSLQQSIRATSERRIRLLGETNRGDRLKVVEQEIADLLAQYQDVEAQIRATSPAYAALTQPQPLTAKEVQTQLLDENTLLLEYSLGEERSYVFAVSPDSLQAFELPKKSVLEKASRRVYSLLTARNVTIPGESEMQKRARLRGAEAQ
jgi:tetratricopeptide (TPR) repeat protein